jgi:hypothetical protein
MNSSSYEWQIGDRVIPGGANQAEPFAKHDDASTILMDFEGLSKSLLPVLKSPGLVNHEEH